MLISHSTLTHAVELAAKYTTPNLRIRLELHALGLQIRGMDKSNFPKLVSFEQIVSWNQLETPVARHILDAVFDKIAKALAENEPASKEKAQRAFKPA
jgi:hypothetical protein